MARAHGRAAEHAGDHDEAAVAGGLSGPASPQPLNPWRHLPDGRILSIMPKALPRGRRYRLVAHHEIIAWRNGGAAMLIGHPADRLNVVRGLTAPIVLFSPFWYGFPDGTLWVAALVIFAVIGDGNYVLHLHIHHPFSTKKWLNILLDLAMGASTGMTASNWRIQHRYGHHRGLDVPYRPNSDWETERYTALGALSFSIRGIWPTFWSPIVESFRKGVLADVKSPINYRWAFVEQCLLILLVLALAAWKPWLVLTFLLPWYALIYFISRYVDYLNHYGCDEHSPNPYERANNSLSRLFNWSCNNFGYHTAHHIKPTAHWTELPEIHAKIADKIPERLLKPVSWSCLLLPYHCLMAWRGRM